MLILGLRVMLHLTRDDLQGQFLVHQSIAMLQQCCDAVLY